MKLIIADDHQIMIDGLMSILSNYPDITIVGMAKNGIQVLSLLESNKTDIVLTDISMPEMDGLTLTKQIKTLYPETKVIALSMHGDTTHINEMIEAGVSGYIYKNASNKELIEALNKVYEGRQYFSDEIAGTILRSITDHTRKKQEEEKVNLTDREKEIIQLIAKEYSNAHIGTELFISERTVETHRKNIYRKTTTTSVVGLIKWAYENKAI
jgi:two-component system nitrate/nitrite response regulator NarL